VEWKDNLEFTSDLNPLQAAFADNSGLLGGKAEGALQVDYANKAGGLTEEGMAPIRALISSMAGKVTTLSAITIPGITTKAQWASKPRETWTTQEPMHSNEGGDGYSIVTHGIITFFSTSINFSSVNIKLGSFWAGELSFSFIDPSSTMTTAGAYSFNITGAGTITVPYPTSVTTTKQYIKIPLGGYFTKDTPNFNIKGEVTTDNWTRFNAYPAPQITDIKLTIFVRE
jgi:hypothetical protein